MAQGTVHLDTIPYARPKKLGAVVNISNTTGTEYTVPSDGILFLQHETGTTGYIRVYYDMPIDTGGGHRIFCYFNPSGSYEHRVIPIYAGAKIGVAGVTGENNSIKYYPFH